MNPFLLDYFSQVLPYSASGVSKILFQAYETGSGNAVLVKWSVEHVKYNSWTSFKSAGDKHLNLEHVHRHLKCRQQDVARERGGHNG